jgi:hypothetical protein
VYICVDWFLTTIFYFLPKVPNDVCYYPMYSLRGTVRKSRTNWIISLFVTSDMLEKSPCPVKERRLKCCRFRQLGGDQRHGCRSSPPGLPDFSWCKIPKREKYTKLPQTIPNVHKI